MKRTVGFLIGLASISAAVAQVNPKDSAITAPLFNIAYGMQFPQKDMAARFGWNSNIGGSFLIKTKTNWLFGAGGTFLFGDNVKDTTILDAIKTNQGFMIDQGGGFADVLMFERGFTATAKLGKIFPVLGPNKNSGFFILMGAGLLQHNIRIETSNGVPQLRDEYLKGYDRLTNGLLLTEFIGYRYFGNKRMVNFYFGVEFLQAFTKSRRSYDIATMSVDDAQRRDDSFGFKVGWTVPLYKRTPQEFYFN